MELKFKYKDENKIRTTETDTLYKCECCGKENYYSTAGYWSDAAGYKIEMTQCDFCDHREPEGSVVTYERTNNISKKRRIEMMESKLNSLVIPYKKELKNKNYPSYHQNDFFHFKPEGFKNIYPLKLKVNQNFEVIIKYNIGKNRNKNISIDKDYFEWCSRNIENFQKAYDNLIKHLTQVK